MNGRERHGRGLAVILTVAIVLLGISAGLAEAAKILYTAGATDSENTGGGSGHIDITAAGDTSEEPGTDGLLAHWSFDDCTATDVTGNGHDGVINGSPKCVPSTCGQALLFDGDDDIDITGNVDDLQFANESMSISVWVQIPDNANTYYHYVLLGRNTSYAGNSLIGLEKARSGQYDGRLLMYVARHGHNVSIASSILDGASLPKNTWLHLVGVVDYENQTARLYVNGEPQNESGSLIAFDLGSGSTDFEATFGSYYNSIFQNGLMDEVRIYNRALTEKEIGELYTLCASFQVVDVDIKPGSCPNPLNVKVNGENLITSARSGRESNLNGVLPLAVLGTADFDVSEIDPTTIALEGVAPLRWAVEDVSTPVPDGAAECECTTAGLDGHVDLTLKFSRTAVAEALGPVENGDEVPLTLTASLFDGTPIQGSDCVVIHARRDNPRNRSLLANGLVPGYLIGNYPNPFNASTVISYSLAEDAQVSLEVFDLLGRRVVRLVNGFQSAGNHEVAWNATDSHGNPAASGMYFYRLIAGDRTESKKMILLK